MWALIKWLVSRLAVVRWLFKILGGFGFLIPLVLLLKSIGWPVLLVLGVLLFPVLIMLFLFGLPIFLVLLVGGMVMGLLGAVMSFGLVVLKFFVMVVVPVWVVWKVVGWMFGRGRGDRGDYGKGPGEHGRPPAPPPPPPPPPPASEPPPEPPII